MVDHIKIYLIATFVLLSLYFFGFTAHNDVMMRFSLEKESSLKLWVDHPAVEDFNTGLVHKTLIRGAFLLLALVLGDRKFQVATTFVMALSTLLYFVAARLTFVNQAFGFKAPIAGILSLEYIPINLLALYGLYALFVVEKYDIEYNSGSKKTNKWLTFAYHASNAFGVLWGAALIFNYEGVISTFSKKDLLSEPHVTALAQFEGWDVLLLVATSEYVWSNSKDSVRNWVAGIAVASMLKALIASVHVTIPINGFFAVLGFALIVCLITGIRQNLGIVGQEDGGVLTEPRNALRFNNYMSSFFLFASLSPILKYVLPLVVQAQHLAPWHSKMAEAFLKGNQIIGALSLLVNIIAWASENDGVIRAALFGEFARHTTLSIALLFLHQGFGFQSTAVWLLFSFHVFSALLTLRALYTDVEGDLWGWLREEFAWSYTPLKGGLYITVIEQSLQAIVHLFFWNALFSPLLTADSVVDGVSHSFGWFLPLRDYNVVFRGLLFLTNAFTLYLVVRAADYEVARILSFVFILFNLIFFTIIDQFLEPSFGSGLTGAPALHSIGPLLIFLGQLAALYHDHVHSEPSSPRKKAGKKKAL